MSLSFCGACDNLETLAIRKGELQYVCLYCGASRDAPPGPVVVSETVYDAEAEFHAHLKDPSIVEDRSLPRIALKCPADGCPGNEAVYIRYDNERLSFLYCCVACRNFWSRTFG